MNSPVEDKLRKQGLLKMLRLATKQRQRLAKLELLRRGLNPSEPSKKD